MNDTIKGLIALASLLGISATAGSIIGCLYGYNKGYDNGVEVGKVLGHIDVTIEHGFKVFNKDKKNEDEE